MGPNFELIKSFFIQHMIDRKLENDPKYQKILTNLLTFMEKAIEFIGDDKLVPIIQGILNDFVAGAKTDEDKDYYLGILNKFNTITNKLSN